MSENISGFGTTVQIIATNTFPVGFTVTQFSDDSNAVDAPSVQIADTAMGLNGDLIKWQRAVPIPLTLTVIAGSTDDTNLQILADANRVAQGKPGANDDITLTVLYPDATTRIFNKGAITSSSFAKSVSSSGRFNTRSYSFMFQESN